MAINPDSILGQAVATVTDKMGEFKALSDTYNNQLSASLNRISTVKVMDVPAPERLDAPVAQSPAIPIGNLPTYQKGDSSPPDLTNIDSLLSGLDLGGMDNIPQAPVAPPVNMPNAPVMQSIGVPKRPAVDTTIDLPASPSIQLPQLESLEQIKLPDFKFPDLPTFDGTPPSASSIQVPNVFISWDEPDYQSEILDDITSKISGMVRGTDTSTGLPPAIEDALFARARERGSAETQRAVQEAVDDWAARDFSMPSGMLAKQVNVIREQGRLNAAELNRDILTQAAQWQIESLRFAVGQGIALEQLTQNLHQNMATRLFEVARFHAESQINVFNARVALFNAENAAFETLGQIYRTKLDGALAHLQAYKAAIDGQVAVGQINQQRVDVYKAKFEAVSANVDIYKAMMQGAQIKSEAVKTQLDAYRTDIQAYAETINAEKTKFDAYETAVKGESAKVGVFEAQTRAYAATVDAYSSRADVKAKEAQLKMEAGRLHVATFSARLDAFKADMQTNLQAFQAQVDAWRAQMGAVTADAEMKSRFSDMNTRTNIAYAEMQVSEYQAKMQNAIQQAQLALEAAKSVGQYTAQLAAGALSAQHVSASISGSGSASASESKSTSTSHNYSY